MVVRATGNAEETKDEQFDELEANFKLYEGLVIKLVDDLKKYKDAIQSKYLIHLLRLE